jgi:Isochorismatase family
MFTFTHRNPEMQIDKPRTALVLADMQNEFLEEKTGTYYELIADALKKRDVIDNLDRLLATAQELGYFIVHSPHWYYPTDGQWVVPPGAIADYLGGIGFCGRKDPVDLEGFKGSRADYFEPFKKYLMDGHTCNIVAAQALRVRGERRHQAAADAQGREGDHGGSCREHLPRVPHARHHRSGNGSRDGS